MTVADVAVPVPVRKTFHYDVPEELEGRLAPGMRVLVPFGPRRLTGFVVDVFDGPSQARLKPVLRSVDNAPLLTPELLELGRRVADRTFCGLGEALTAFVPAAVRKGARGRRTTIWHSTDTAAAALAEWPDTARLAAQRRVLELLVASSPDGRTGTDVKTLAETSDSPLRTLEKRGLVRSVTGEVTDDPFERLDVTPKPAPEPNPTQCHCIDAVDESPAGSVHLLHGVTGSGKTEVYLRCIERALERGESAIVLVPEISLTPQTIERFESRLGSVAVLHSHLGDGARANQWRDLREGRKRIAIGPRSAVFAPVARLGLIIIDEEHETTFKQQNVPRYLARDVARDRVEIEGARLILGSATPSLEVWEEAQRGEINLLSMPSRVAGRPLPAVSLVDMRSEKPMGPGGMFSGMLIGLVRDTLERGEQVLLFLNRRGFNTTAFCTSCGSITHCRNCDIPLVHYRRDDRLLCHYCSYTLQPRATCRDCGAPTVKFRGYGTEAVEHAAKRMFPDARTERMDGASTQKRHAHERIFDALRNGEIDILVGTQMVAKGLDIPGISLVGVISGDTSLAIPDFRSAERTFQLVTQVSGRAGRGGRPGRVLVQTYQPDHYSLIAAANHDYVALAHEELTYRKNTGYPPFGRLARVVVHTADEAVGFEQIEAIAAALRPRADPLGVSILGPAPCPLAFIRRQYRHHLLLRAGRRRTHRSLARRSRASLRVEVARASSRRPRPDEFDVVT